VLFVATDRWSRTIHCTKVQWRDHVCSHHPHLVDWGEYARQTIEDPDAVLFDAHHKDCESFYRSGMLPGVYWQFYLKVVVRFEDHSGQVVTAYVTDRYKAEERIKWIAHRSS